MTTQENLVAMTDINISWHCPARHTNAMTYCFDIMPGEDVDYIVADFCSDEINQEEYPCHECHEQGFENVSWSYNRDFLDQELEIPIELSPAA